MLFLASCTADLLRAGSPWSRQRGPNTQRRRRRTRL